MDHWLDQTRNDLEQLRAASLLRQLEEVQLAGARLHRGGREMVNLASNDYLGLSHHPRLRQAATAAIATYGTGSGSSRLVIGHLTPHARAEQRFARFKGAEAALLCPTGYMANLAALTTLAGPGDLVCLDKLSHASLIDAARASGATLRVFPHLGYAKLQRLLAGGARLSESRLNRAGARQPRKLIVTDSIFSMDGDAADLPALCDLADRYDAILIVDEAHGTGVLGPSGAGLGELQGVSKRIDVTVSTASKALGGLGGIVTARREVIDAMVNHARAFIYTTAVPPSQAAVLEAALDVLADEPWRRVRLAELSGRFRAQVAPLGFLPPSRSLAGPAVVTPIFPLVVGTPQHALALAEYLAAQGLYAPAIRPPTVAPGAARVRVSLRADLDDSVVERLAAALVRWK
jgi:8-amino-7-oxononanoate synthase